MEAIICGFMGEKLSIRVPAVVLSLLIISCAILWKQGAVAANPCKIDVSKMTADIRLCPECSEGVKWAAEELGCMFDSYSVKSLSGEVKNLKGSKNQLILVVAAADSKPGKEIISLKKIEISNLGEEGFRYVILDEKSGIPSIIAIVAKNSSGLMYGLLNLYDGTILNSGNVAFDDAPDRPAMGMRAIIRKFPFFLGTEWYTGAPKNNNNDQSTNWWWYDKEYWTRTFKTLATLRINGIMFDHSNPFPALIKYEGQDGKIYHDIYNRGGDRQIAVKDIDRSIEHFRWMIAEAQKYNIKLYFLIWMLETSAPEANDAVDPKGVDSPKNRAYLRHLIPNIYEKWKENQHISKKTA